MKSSIDNVLMLAFFALIIVLSCTTKDGEIVTFQSSVGSVFVSSTTPGARIFLDYKDIGQTTPFLINNVRIGKHVVHIFLETYVNNPDSVLVEVKEGKETTINFEVTNVPNVGNLDIATAPDSALVRINKLEFGLTPLLVTGLVESEYQLQLLKGSHEIVLSTAEVKANQVTKVNETLALRRMVLLEHFSNTDCIPCVDVDEIVEDVLADFGIDEVASVGYHPPFPGPADPFYLAAKEQNDNRTDYYDPPFMPFIMVDGTKNVFHVPLSQFRGKLITAFEERKLAPPQAALEILSFETNGDELSADIKITAIEELGTDIMLRIALINRSVQAADPPGVNGQTYFIDVMRDFDPSPEGIPISLSAEQKKMVSFTFVRDEQWPENLEVVAFLQNDATNEVLQSIWTVFYK
jgi:hypothetical protein